ncbi:MAG: hypothetical protein HUU01_00620 [Saprospiraceae bacterium]|nr:hypothetical protein [Saprospiraceae bacterium]
MKFPSLFFSVALGAGLFFSACQNNGPDSKNSPVETTGTQPVTTPITPQAVPTDPAKPVEPAQNASGVWHYTCSQGCEGGAGSAVACAKCGTMLVHNAAYHNTQTAPTTATQAPSIATQPAVTTPTKEPAQNAKGVWHYTCASGCAGGAGSATACAKCGKTLVHNGAYHQ